MLPQEREISDTPRIDMDDELTLQEPSSKLGLKEETKSIDSQVRAAIATMSAAGQAAEANYQAELLALVSNPQAAIAAIGNMYRTTPEDAYIARWSQVHLLSDLRQNAALELFDSILSTPIPPEKMPNMITYSTVGEEVMIRTTAIEGITRLAAKGDHKALDLLRKYVKHEALSVKRAAIQGYLETGGSNAREELRKILPEKDEWLLDIRRMDVHDVPQPQIEKASDTKDQPPPARITTPKGQE